ncbi:MAG TPA: MaoC family dehydratase N-terminal domain-containing protein [Ramlibacter sp.]|uniref:FAS1-like dehydratase domain-containing protein n=1 Tax=Ramlibacter sp. TaxID=1917967 RepID=UPI002C84DE48|nr:MaoC family dehydratase N-terminal domain-containing protein [Ramlibacter sp.]HVZ42212.1 MaoC family dehydratase N-terminal domain-containing protein [Ramlibacter sp.]
MDDTTAEEPLTPERMAELESWEGRSEVLEDEATEAPVRGLAATLDIEPAPLGAAGELPALWHWLYFLPRAAQHMLRGDGHPKLGGFMPPVPLPRRMWAGGRLQWHAPLRLGDRLRRVSTIQSIAHKAGRTGDLVFVTVRHEIGNERGAVLTEEQDIVYRAPTRPGDAAPSPRPAPESAAWSREIRPDPVLLFRYSALTFNAHRIHYDRPYATGEEGYEGLVVHGPLIATLLADLARRERPDVRFASFSFKAIRPTLDIHPFRVCGALAEDDRSARLWGCDHDGFLTMQADVRFD